MTLRSLTFPLVPRRRLTGLAFGAMHGGRRGSGSDVAGSRAYVPGDDPDTIDWAATARLSAARGTDEFVVREHFADEAPRVVIVSDRRSEMTICPPDWPWLAKGEAVSVATSLIVDSVDEARGLIGYVDYGRDARTCGWCPPATNRGAANIVEHDLPRACGSVRTGRRRAGPRVPRHPPPLGARRQLRVRALRLPRRDAARCLGARARSRRGTSSRS